MHRLGSGYLRRKEAIYAIPVSAKEVTLVSCRAANGLWRSSCPAPCGVELLPQLPLLTQGLCARLALPLLRAGFTFSLPTVHIVFHISEFKESLKLTFVGIITDGLKGSKIMKKVVFRVNP